MRRAAKVDFNQAEIVAALRAAGATVSSTAAVGGGFPDLVVGYHHRGEVRNYLIEIKDPHQDKCKRKLTPDQKIWHLSWKGQVAVVETIEEAFSVVGIPFNP